MTPGGGHTADSATVRDAHDTLVEACWSPDDVAEWVAALARLEAAANRTDEERKIGLDMFLDAQSESLRAEDAEAERDAARQACEKAIRERRSLEQKEDGWHTAYEHAQAECDAALAKVKQCEEAGVWNLARDLNAALAALRIPPLTHWEALAEDDIMDLIDRDTMFAFIAAARAVLGGPEEPPDKKAD